MLFRGVFESEIEDGHISMQYCYREQLQKQQKFIIEPNEVGGFVLTPISSQLSDIAPPQEIIQMDRKARIRVPNKLINQAKHEKTQIVIIVGCMDHFEIYSLKSWEDIQKSHFPNPLALS